MTSRPDLLILIHDLARHLRLEADRRASRGGLTRAQWGILFWLDRQPGLSQKELAELLEVEPISVARLIDRLQDRGLVERRDDPDDRRIWRLHLRPLARPVIKDMLADRETMLGNLTAGLDQETLDTVAAALVHMKVSVLARLRDRQTAVQEPA
jgi:DNA-binding MarR family transcriptional regulator